MISGVTNLAEMERRLSATVSDTAQWQAHMRSVVVNSISPEDVKAIVAKQVEKAKAGDPVSAKFVMSQFSGQSAPLRFSQTNIVTDPETAARLARQCG